MTPARRARLTQTLWLTATGLSLAVLTLAPVAAWVDRLPS